MSFDPLIAATRFGTGLSPRFAPPQSVGEVVSVLDGPDQTVVDRPIPKFADVTLNHASFVALRRAENAAATEAEKERATEAVRAWRLAARDAQYDHAMRRFGRGITAPLGLHERLTDFWADHFTVEARNGIYRHLITPFVEEAIRPHVTGSFPEMLTAVATHPMMLHYLQQIDSHGPNSAVGLRRGRGLNENLARELLELHSLGVGGNYSQTDVTELAELLTGLTVHPIEGFHFRAGMAEPGSETVLGVSYGPKATLQTIKTALEDIALHPDTAQHVARKLAVHFVSDTPDPDLVGTLAEVFLQTEGDLQSVVATLLDHPAAWTSERSKVRTPVEFIVAAMRALDVDPDALLQLDQRNIRRWIEQPLRVMGQPWQDPVGPDGWPEQAQAWIIPQAMAGRITWAMQAPTQFVDPLPDPRDFVRTALGDLAPLPVIFAAQSAERRSDGIGIVLASPAFQRR